MDLNIAIAVLVGMFLCHLLADYPLQGWLAQAKAKSYWANSAKDNRNDWIAALAGHAIMWGILVMAPVAIASNFQLDWFWVALPINIVLHYIIDNQKANKRQINLIQDQCLHVVQILITWDIWINVYIKFSIACTIIFTVLSLVTCVLGFVAMDKDREERQGE